MAEYSVDGNGRLVVSTEPTTTIDDRTYSRKDIVDSLAYYNSLKLQAEEQITSFTELLAKCDELGVPAIPESSITATPPDINAALENSLNSISMEIPGLG